MSRPSVVIAGSVAQRPFIGGHTWVFLHLLLGFRKMGWDVHLIDRLEPGMCVDATGAPSSFLGSANLAYLSEVMQRFDLADCWTLGHDGWRDVAGVPRRQAIEKIRRSQMVLNVMGFLDDAEMLDAAPCRVFFDIDPGFGQMWRELGLHDLFAGHDRFVTVGENVGRAGCGVPTCGLDWITTKQPVVTDLWDATVPPRPVYTSVVSWRGPFGPIEYRGKTYGLRVHEFRRFLPLPELTSCSFELALAIDPADDRDRVGLIAHGWQLVDPRIVAADPWLYREYVERSRAEVMVAKHMYVETRSGWFSDRSACYLAAGRPVVAQDTGLADNISLGVGLIAFEDLDGAVDAIRQIESDWARHSASAREVAEEFFAAEVVLTRLVERLGVG